MNKGGYAKKRGEPELRVVVSKYKRPLFSSSLLVSKAKS